MQTEREEYGSQFQDTGLKADTPEKWEVAERALGRRGTGAKGHRGVGAQRRRGEEAKEGEMAGGRECGRG